jgi:hypothetical protein
MTEKLGERSFGVNDLEAAAGSGQPFRCAASHVSAGPNGTGAPTVRQGNEPPSSGQTPKELELAELFHPTDAP